jgi:uncharacterized membrane protein YphA (DoxX/SURF4 family)
MRSVALARALIVISVAGVALLSLAYGDFVPLGQNFAHWLPWRGAWVQGCALFLLAAGVGLCFSRTALPSALALCVYQAAFAVICALPVLSQPLGVGAWYGFCEALAPLIGALILYTLLRGQSGRSQTSITGARALRTAQVLFGLSCVFYGWSHFAYADYTATFVPSWLPGRLGFAYLTGLGHVAAGIGLVVGVLPRLAATLEATMMSLFGLLVWVPSFFAQPTPAWATPPQVRWSELVVTFVLAASAWVIAMFLGGRPWGSRANA